MKHCAYFKLTAHDAVDAGVLEAAEVEDARRVLPEHAFRELYLAEPADDGGNPFDLAAIRECVVPELSDAVPVCFGVDLAKSRDWTVVCGMDASGCVCVLERWQADWGQTIHRILDLVGTTPTLVDATGAGDPVVEQLQRGGAGDAPSIQGLTFTALRKQQLMESLAIAIQQGEVRFPDGWLVHELEAFEFQYAPTGVRYSAPAGLHDDGVCALALCNARRRELAGAIVHYVGAPTLAV